MIQVRYESIDNFSKARKFKTLKAAQKFAQRYLGPHPTLGTTYAVSDDGIGRITVQGAALDALFPTSGENLYVPLHELPAVPEYPTAETEEDGADEPLTGYGQIIADAAKIRNPTKRILVENIISDARGNADDRHNVITVEPWEMLFYRSLMVLLSVKQCPESVTKWFASHGIKP